MSTPLYTQEQLDIALLKQQSGTTTQTLTRIESELISMDKKIDGQFKWILSVMGAVVLTVGTAVIQHWIK